jgi:menaquinone-dependent protoporphyrinogen oxidase
MKALIAYGSRYGTSAEIAEEIGKFMENDGIEVDVVNLMKNKVYDVQKYDLIVVGSGIKMGKWTKEPLKFLKKNENILEDKKVALFVSCGAANDPKTVGEGQEKYLDDVAGKYLINKPVATGLFGSLYDPNAKQGLLYKMTMRFYKKELEEKGIDTTKPYDYRDWEEIREWAHKLAEMLNQ